MEYQITVREAVTEQDAAAFWEQLRTYFKRDMFPDPAAEDLAYFLGDEYRIGMQRVHDRPQDRNHYLFFDAGGRDIGFALPVIFTSEDGKCFIMEFCIYPEYRGNGTGTACARALLHWAKKHGAKYAELNYGSDARRLRFWQRLGFVENGADEWGEPLMLLPPAEDIPITVEVLSDPKDWQLKKLENGFLKEIGEDPLSEKQQEQLSQAVRDGRIAFFFGKRGYRAVGMCSVVKHFSTFACTDTGVFEDFYVEPAFRKRGVARMLVQAAQSWSREQGLSGLTVCCAPCDESMYQSLGFDAALGKTYTRVIGLAGEDLPKHKSAPPLELRTVTGDIDKANIARVVLEALPDWFGIPAAREEYISGSEGQPFFCAYMGGRPVGFLYLKETGRHTVELAVMGVLQEFHRTGIGKSLFLMAREEAKRRDYAFVQVKTVQMGRYESYDATNRFYLSLGFKELEVFPALWDECSPCQIYIMAL